MVIQVKDIKMLFDLSEKAKSLLDMDILECYLKKI